MRRLARYTLNALTALSLLLCVATVALWVRSCFAFDRVSWGSRDEAMRTVNSCYVWQDRGRFYL